MNDPTCPTDGTLTAYLCGRATPSDLDLVSAHLGICPACVMRLDRLERQADSIVVALRDMATEDYHPAVENTTQVIVRRATEYRVDSKLGPGSILGEYRLLEILGEGGMGVVYEATHARLNKRFAVKVIRGNRTDDSAAVSRFEQEMRTVGALDHPNLVRATDAGEINGVPYLVMELLVGKDLAKHVKTHGPLSLAEASSVVYQAAQGLSVAHARGLVHRDLKPSNLMRMPDGEVKVLDLGLALVPGMNAHPPSAVADTTLKMAGSTGTGLTTPGCVLGTRDYMAPEQLGDPHRVGPAADVYGLGATLWYLLTGSPPPQGGHLPTGQLPGRLSRRTWSRFLAQNPAERFATMAEVATATKRIAHPPKRWVWWGMAAGIAVTAVLAIRPWGSGSGAGLDMSGPVKAVAGLPTQDLAASAPKNPTVTQVAARTPPNVGLLPMKPEQAVALQQAWARHLDRPTVEENSIGMSMALIPPGECALAIQNSVVITRPFAVSRHEVTRKQFAAFAASGYVTTAEQRGVGQFAKLVLTPDAFPQRVVSNLRKVDWRTPGYPDPSENDAVVHVNWDDAVAFCRWLSARENRIYRLPTEAEWVWAARAGEHRAYPGMETAPKRTPQQLVTDQPMRPMPVGTGTPNAWGLYDTMGNVSEWCLDEWGELPLGRVVDYVNRKGDKPGSRVTRGPSYVSSWTNLFWREVAPVDLARSNIGFRVVCEIVPPAK